MDGQSTLVSFEMKRPGKFGCSNELDGTRDELVREMRCEAGSNIDEREFVKNE
jgi:hypothetical protein